MRLFFLLLLTFGILSSPGIAESVLTKAASHDSVGGPSLGIIHDDELGLRPLLGIPSSARLGVGPDDADGLRILESSAAQRYAIGASADGAVRMVRLATESGWSVSDLQVPGGVTRVVLSPTGKAALLVYAASGNVAALTGMPDAPRIAWRNRLPRLPGALGSLAVTDDGEVVLACVQADGQQFLARITAAEGWLSIAPLEGPSVIEFKAGSHDAAILEKASSRASIVYDAGTAARWTPLVDEEAGISDPVAVAFSGDGERLLVANANPASVTEIRIADRSVNTVASRWAPTSLDRLAGNAVFSLGKPPGGPLMLYDGDRSPQRVALVVSPRTITAGEGGVE